MARGIRLLRPSLLRPLLHAHLSKNPLPAQYPPPLLYPHGVLPSPPNAPRPLPLPRSHASSDALFLSRRPFSSPSSPSNIVVIGSEEALNTALTKVQDEKMPAIFYFTAVWCGPCRFISPIIEEMGLKFPHVTTYKIDIDMGTLRFCFASIGRSFDLQIAMRSLDRPIKEGLGGMLSKLKIYSVPTFHFFQNGQKATEIVGADATKLKNTMEDLYKKE